MFQAGCLQGFYVMYLQFQMPFRAWNLAFSNIRHQHRCNGYIVTRLAMAAKIWVQSFVQIVQKMFYIEIEWYIDPRKGYNDVIFE